MPEKNPSIPTEAAPAVVVTADCLQSEMPWSVSFSPDLRPGWPAPPPDLPCQLHTDRLPGGFFVPFLR